MNFYNEEIFLFEIKDPVAANCIVLYMNCKFIVYIVSAFDILGYNTAAEEFILSSIILFTIYATSRSKRRIMTRLTVYLSITLMYEELCAIVDNSCCRH